jgi:hypothetical protein
MLTLDATVAKAIELAHKRCVACNTISDLERRGCKPDLEHLLSISPHTCEEDIAAVRNVVVAVSDLQYNHGQAVAQMHIDRLLGK